MQGQLQRGKATYAVVYSLSPSFGRRLIKGGGVYVNNAKVTSETQVVAVEDLIEGRLLLLAAGKKNKMLVRIVD